MGILSKNNAKSEAEARKNEGRDITHEDFAELETPLDKAAAAEAIEADLGTLPKQERAVAELEAFELSHGAASLLDRAMDNIARNKGTNIPDADGRLKVKALSDLVEASGNNLGIVIECITAEAPTLDAPGQIYSICYQTLKAAAFIANIDYRRSLDPKQDLDLNHYIRGSQQLRAEFEALGGSSGFNDAREEDAARDVPPGFDPSCEVVQNALREQYGRGHNGGGEMTMEQVIIRSLEDLQLFLQLTVESFGWDSEDMIPFMNIAEADGNYTPVANAERALDQLELRWQAAKAKRARDSAIRMAAAAARAKDMVAKALARKSK